MRRSVRKHPGRAMIHTNNGNVGISQADEHQTSIDYDQTNRIQRRNETDSRRSMTTKLVVPKGESDADSKEYSYSWTNLVGEPGILDEEKLRMENSKDFMGDSNDFDNTVNLEFMGKSPRDAVRGTAKNVASGVLESMNNGDRDLLE